MEFKQVVGTRRTIRFFKPWVPVEREKIQIILESANRSSRSMNADYVKALVVNRAELAQETIDLLRVPTAAAALDLAPTYIFWYLDLNYGEPARERLRELLDVGALAASHGWSEAYIDNVVHATVIKPLLDDPQGRLWMGAIESGIAICQAMLAAVDEGLGVALQAFNSQTAKKAFEIPDHWMPCWLMLLGYPAEDPAAGGQRPRRPLSESFFEGNLGTPWREDPKVTERLRGVKLLQAPAPLPWRKQELKFLARMFGLPE